MKKNKINIAKELQRCKGCYSEQAIKKQADEVLMYMLRKHQFYAEVIMQAQVSANINLPSTAAMAIDKTTALFMFGPLFMTKYYSFANQMADAIHEVEHFMRLHAMRGKNKDKRLWNIACDITINQLIENLAPEPLSIFPSTYKLDNDLTEEQYYKLLQQVKKEQEQERKDKNKEDSKGEGNENKGDGKGEGNGAGDESEGNDEGDDKGEGNDERNGNGTGEGDGKGEGTGNGTGTPDTDSKGRAWLPSGDFHPHWDVTNQNTNASMQQAVTADVVNRAIKASKSRGSLPNHIEELAAWLNQPPKINWRQELKQYVGTALRGAYAGTWSRMNRRSIKLTKGRMRKNGKRIVVALDTSGSMSSTVLNEMINELKYMRKLKEADIWMVMCDAEIAWTGKIEKFSKLPDKFYGRGGTSFVPVFNWIENEDINPNILIFLTDGEGTYPEQEPLDYTTIWLMVEGKKPTVDWGRVINYPASSEEL